MTQRFLPKLVLVASAVLFAAGCAPNPYAHIVTLLGSKGPAAKERAAAKLAGMKGQEYIDALVKALYDPNQRVIIAAAKSLAKTGNPQAIKHLQRLLSDNRGAVRRAAADALKRFKDVRAAEALLRSKDARDRAIGIDMLGRLRLPGAVSALAFALGDRDAANRLAAVRALSAIGTDEAASALKSAASDPERRVRQEAIKALSKMEGAAAFAALSASSENSLELARKMEQLVLHFLKRGDLKAAIAADANSLTRYMVYYCTNYVQQDIYGQRDKALVQLLFSDLPNSIIEEMRAMQDALVGSQLSRLATTAQKDYVRAGRYTPRSFLAAATEEAPTKEGFVTETVRYLSNVVAANTKSLVVVEGRQPSASEYAVLGLSQIDAPDAALALVKAASRSYYDYYVLRGLVDLGPKARYALLSALSSPNRFIRSQAMLALAFLPDPEVGSIASNQLAKETDPVIRLHCQFAIYRASKLEAKRSKMADAILDALESGNTEVVLRAAYIFWYLEEPIPEPLLLHLLSHPDDRVKRRAADICAKKPIASPSVLQALASLAGHSNKLVRDSVSDALAAIDRKALPTLAKMVKSKTPAVRMTAARALAKMGGHEAARLLLALTDDAVANIRAYSIESLGRVVEEIGRGPLVGEAVQRISAILGKAKRTNVLRACIWALGRLRAYNSAGTIIRLMRRRPKLRKQAAFALSLLAEKPSVKRKIISNFRRTHDFGLAYAAAVHGVSQTRQPIRDALLNGEFGDRILAAEMLARLKDAEALPQLELVADFESKSLEPFDFYLRHAAHRAAVQILLDRYANPSTRGLPDLSFRSEDRSGNIHDRGSP